MQQDWVKKPGQAPSGNWTDPSDSESNALTHCVRYVRLKNQFWASCNLNECQLQFFWFKQLI